MKLYVLFAAFLAVTLAQKQEQYTTPVPILKQINRHNEDGSYSYGYEAADGSYKIESKYPNGEVYGKYGYVDDQGKLREIEYGASRRGFEPAGSEVNVAPPTLTNNANAQVRPLAPNEEDDGQYREDPAIYYQDEVKTQNQNQQPVYQSRYTQPQTYQPAPVQQQTYQPAPVQQQTYQPAPVQQQTYRPAPVQQTYQPAPVQQTYQPAPVQQSYQPAPVQQTYQPAPAQQTYQPAPVQQTYQPAPVQQTYQQPAYQPTYQQPAPQPAFRPQTSFSSFSSNSQPSYYNPAPSGQFNGHPATNIDINSGSYSVQYK